MKAKVIIAQILLALLLTGCVTVDVEAPVQTNPQQIEPIKVEPMRRQTQKPQPITRKLMSEDQKALEFMQSDLGEWIASYCYNQGISPYVIFAIAERESNFNADQMGDNGESYGLMQVQPKWCKDKMQQLKADNLLDPRQCVKVAVAILLEYADIDGEENELYYVLMAYNGGEYYARHANNISEYALEVADRAAELTQIYEGGASNWSE